MIVLTPFRHATGPHESITESLGAFFLLYFECFSLIDEHVPAHLDLSKFKTKVLYL